MKPIRARMGKRDRQLALSPDISMSPIIVRVILLLAGVAMLSACGTTSKSSETSGPLSGNWQFQIVAQDSSFSSPGQNCGQPQSGTALCVGGFVLQKGGSATGQLQYSIITPSTPPQTFCNSGSAILTGTVSGQNVTLTALAGNETFSLTGTLTADGSTMTGSYTSDGQGCGNPQTGSGSTWTATRVLTLSGAVQGIFHSTNGNSTIRHQDFPVTGFLTQGSNVGANSASVTGTLSFQGYPCLDNASVNGQISGNTVILQIIGTNGLNVGQIGAVPGSSNPGPVTFNSSSGGYILQGSNGYGLSTKGCKGSGPENGDIGNVCLGLGNKNACNQPISLSPSFLSFPAQLVGSSAISQSFTLTNTDPSGTALSLQLTFPDPSSTPSDFDGVPSFSEQDTCATSPGSAFTLNSQQSCTITVSFTPQQSCPWLPSVSLGGEAPSSCPPFLPVSVGSPPALFASLKVGCSNCNAGIDTDPTFAASVFGIGVSAIQPSTPELDFGAEKAPDATGAGGEASLPQSVSFTNQGSSSIQILPATNPVCNPQPRPAIAGLVPGFQVIANLTGAPPALTYTCDLDQGIGGQGGTNKPNFQITSDNCSGTVLAPKQSCSIAITYGPQPNEPGALDYFLELNTTECTSTVTTNCEIDSGRFPVELKSNLPSPLRMSPGAGLDFGTQLQSETSPPLTITLENDATVANPATVNFNAKILTGGDYAETDDCGVSLAPGSSCTLSITFTPSAQGFEKGNILITYSAIGWGVGQTQTVYMRGFGR